MDGLLKLLLDTRGFYFYSKLVLGPSKWIMLMGKANKSSELQTPAFDGCVVNAYDPLPDLQPSLDNFNNNIDNNNNNSIDNNITIKIVVCVKETFASCEFSD